MTSGRRLYKNQRNLRLLYCTTNISCCLNISHFLEESPVIVFLALAEKSGDAPSSCSPAVLVTSDARKGDQMPVVIWPHANFEHIHDRVYLDGLLELIVLALFIGKRFLFLRSDLRFFITQKTVVKALPPKRPVLSEPRHLLSPS
ncbi:hypothetical protein DTO280E4_293 [Paecilomyces variotii]|nr:hypothetical protein DTO280E4_293 [Paecilomyces variotii]